jgi:hypothetical protein
MSAQSGARWVVANSAGGWGWRQEELKRRRRRQCRRSHTDGSRQQEAAMQPAASQSLYDRAVGVDALIHDGSQQPCSMHIVGVSPRGKQFSKTSVPVLVAGVPDVCNMQQLFGCICAVVSMRTTSVSSHALMCPSPHRCLSLTPWPHMRPTIPRCEGHHVRVTCMHTNRTMMPASIRGAMMQQVPVLCHRQLPTDSMGTWICR